MAINFGLNDLPAFRAVAKPDNFRKAVESIHISQPAFSRRYHEKSSLFRVRLFDAGANEVLAAMTKEARTKTSTVRRAK